MSKIDFNHSTLMQNRKVTVVALLLMFAVSFSLVALPAVNAHTPSWTVSTYAFINAAPNPVGVGQTVTINFWLDKVPPTAQGNWGMMWHNMTIAMTKPDGTTQILGPLSSDAVGGTWTTYVPDQTGTYSFVGHFPGQVVKLENPNPYAPALNPAFINDTYTGSTSSTATITVQQQQITSAYPDNPFPTGYWQRPINSMNRNWYSLGGNWLGLAHGSFSTTGLYSPNGNFNPYTTAPNSAHVIWTKPMAFGGQIGGEFGATDRSIYATGTAYEPKFNPVVIYGILYYTQYPGAASNPGPLTAVDLRTGKTLFTINSSDPLKCGMTYNFITGNQYGAHAYIITTSWSMYDAMTGQFVLKIANVPAATTNALNSKLVEGPNGELLSYYIDPSNNLVMWNSSTCIAVGTPYAGAGYSPQETWRPPQGATINWTGGIQWSIPLPTSISGVPIGTTLYPTVGAETGNALLVAYQSGFMAIPGGSQPGYEIDIGYNANTGQLLWGPTNKTLTPYTDVYLGPAGDGIYTEFTQQTMSWIGYSINTGNKVWGPTQPFKNDWGYFGAYGGYVSAQGVIGYGNLYTWTLGGEVYCFDDKTGALKWSWSTGSAGYDTPYSIYPFWPTNPATLADGKIYIASSHDYTPPVYKGAKLYCINATTGNLLWSTFDFGGTQCNSYPAADGVYVINNCYDNQIYAYSQGQSATTVNISPVFGNSNSVLIKGTVTDQSPGQTCLGIPAADTPAISDASMSQWMEYLYQQQPMPTNATGVPVTLSVFDPNNNTYVIGITTSDMKGNFAFAWTPPVPGLYKVTATFAGSNSYYSSNAETSFAISAASAASAIVVTPAPAQTAVPTTTLSSSPVPTIAPTPSPAVKPPANAAPMMTYVAIAAAVVIIAVVVAAIALRRKK